MSGPYPQVPIGEVLSEAKEWIILQPQDRYTQVTVRLWGKGVVARGTLPGAEIAAPRQVVVRAGQFILSRIDARNGAFGIVPEDLDGAVVSNDFPVYTPNAGRILPAYLGWLSKTHRFVEVCRQASEGTTNRKRLKEDRFLTACIPLPPLDEQRRIVAWIEALAGKIEAARGLRREAESEMRSLLVGVYHNIVEGCPVHAMADVAPLVRRPQDVKEDGIYHELGIRSFGRGTFHKPPVSGLELGTKRIFRIQHNDLLFNIVFAWEGAVAVASTADDGRVGSHRFLACVPQGGIATPRFLAYHFLTDQGLASLGEASPGGAGRNRTLGLKALEAIQVPVPDFGFQLRFDKLLAQTDAVERLRSQATAELDALLPSVLERAFSGGL